MKKLIFLIMFIMIGAFVSGCGNEKTESAGLSLPDTQGKDIAFEKMEQPALVFFFTGIE
ncbi:hypothetical protein [Bacillus sp. REN3]|uniref:hypothetical protein n=1 Tax=Bacillus sp. REN3 TaxID=2802440 RepID=UPI001AEE3D9C|nr:hypothetical protein [Bacillus sp. REN3]